MGDFLVSMLRTVTVRGLAGRRATRVPSSRASKLTHANLYVNPVAMSERPAPQSILPEPAGAIRRGRGRPSSSGTDGLDEEDLLAAVFAVFAESGYEATTVRDLSRRLGVSHNLLHVRFGKKADLWKAAVDRRFAAAARPVEDVFTGERSAEEKLRDLIERFCAWTRVNPDIVAISQQEAHVNSWRVGHIHSHFTGPFQARLEALLDEVRRHRPVAEISSGALLSLLVHGIGMYFAADPMRRRLDPGLGDDPVDHALRAGQFARLLMDGLLPPAAA